MTKPSGVRTWLNQRRLDATLRSILLDSSSPTIRQLRKALVDAEINATTQDVTQWFRGHLGTPITTLPILSKQASERDQLSDSGQGPRPPSSRNSSIRESQMQTGFGDDASELFVVLREAIHHRLPDVVWRTTRSYSAAGVRGSTFLAIRERRNHLMLGLTLPSTATSDRLSINERDFNWARMTKVTQLHNKQDIDEELLAIVEMARSHAETELRTKVHHGVTLRDLIGNGLLEDGTPLTLLGASNRVVARATLNASGEIEYNGNIYRSPSDKVFAKLMGRTSLNGWTHWYAILPEGSVPLDTIRTRYWDVTRSDELPGSPATNRSA
jgi:hypothetical protein